MHMQMITSSYPAVSLPSADVITQPAIRKAAENHVAALQRVIDSHAIVGRLKAGHNIDNLTPEEIATAITVSRDGLSVQADAREGLLSALGEHRHEWVEDTEKRTAKAHAAALKALKTARDALDTYETLAGVLGMLSSGSLELRWKPGDAVYEIGAVREPLAAVIDKLTGTEQ